MTDASRRPREIAPGRWSAIRKAPLAPPWRIEAEGLVGDWQADRRHHGGVEKALHHYPREHYDAWRMDAPELANEFVALAFGTSIPLFFLSGAFGPLSFFGDVPVVPLIAQIFPVYYAIVLQQH